MGAGSEASSFAWLIRGATSFVRRPSSAVKGLLACGPESDGSGFWLEGLVSDMAAAAGHRVQLESCSKCAATKLTEWDVTAQS